MHSLPSVVLGASLEHLSTGFIKAPAGGRQGHMCPAPCWVSCHRQGWSFPLNICEAGFKFSEIPEDTGWHATKPEPEPSATTQAGCAS